MFTGVFKDRTRTQADPAQPAEQLLAALLRSRLLHRHRFARHCEIGPFVVDHVCRELSLIVELLPPIDQPRDKYQFEARSAFLAGMGYRVIHVSPRELKAQPHKVLARIRAAMRR
jgi:very-short-patch-repair endonuclease